MCPEQLEVHQQEIHLGIPDALADAERRTVHSVHARLDRRETVRETEPAVAVPVS